LYLSIKVRLSLLGGRRVQASIDCGFMASRVKRPENVAFGLRLRMARENARNGLGYSQQQVAAWLGISYKTVSQYENGGAEFPSRWLPELSRRLGVTVGWFFEIEEAPGVTRNEDREWLGYMGKRLAMLPPGRLRDE